MATCRLSATIDVISVQSCLVLLCALCVSVVNPFLNIEPIVPHLLNSIDEQLAPWLKERGQGAYRVGQVRRWLFAQRASDFREMTDLPQAPARRVGRRFHAVEHARSPGTRRPTTARKSCCSRWPTAGRSSACCLRDETRRTICISTQVGCGMGCVFCASGLDGLARNLTTGEIVEQMLRLQLLLEPDERLSHIVVMGMGEPLANLDALLPALDEASREDGLGISARRITISTVGLAEGHAPAGRDESAVSAGRFAPRAERRAAPTDRAGQPKRFRSPMFWPRPTTISSNPAGS